ncbi:MAG: Rne/Rng family ribonuclease, partial [Actinomycetales bacterium]|nr:Rne/Rng family ribonuclease [Actinomycetales bacterium]
MWTGGRSGVPTVTEQNDSAQNDSASRPARRRAVRKAAAPVQAPPAASAPAEALDLGAELAELAAPAKKATRARKAPVKAVPDIVVPERSDDGAPAVTETPAATDATAASEGAAPAKRTARKRVTKAASAPAPAQGDSSEAAPETPVAEAAAQDAPAKKATRSRRSAKSAEAPAGDFATSDAAQPAAGEKSAPTRSRRGKKAAPAEDAAPSTTGSAAADAGTTTTSGSGSPRLATTAVLFQAPDPALARPKRRRVTAEAGSPEKVREQVETVEDEELEVALDADGQPIEGDEAAETQDAEAQDAESQDEDSHDDSSEDDSEEKSSGSSRRRRRRGGRGRRSKSSSGGSDEDSSESSEDDSSGKDDSGSQDQDEDGSDASSDDSGDGGSSSRRRRRRRSRSGRSGDSSDDSRSSRNDEVTALRGSTRLEAKRQRRREGRDAGRRRQVLTEAEFLARRESVERAMVVRESNGRTQIAVLEDGVLAEHYVSRSTQVSMVGNVYLGRVQNVLPSMEAAFVDVGKGRNAVLYAGEVNWDAAGLEGQPRRIETALKSGDSVLVQVTKDPIGHKGARLTSQVTLAGRYLVFVPGAGMTGISRKLPEKERARLKKLLREIVPESSGVIVRTAAEGASEEELRADIARLTEQWAKIEKKSKTASAPALLQGEADLAIRVVRDIFNDDFSSLVVQGKEAWDTISGYVADLAPDLSSKLSRWTGEKDVFAEHRIDEQIAKGMDRKVWLPSGGSLVIDRTEAMTVVDVNTGKFTGTGGTLEETVTRNNLEAAEEIVRQ